MDGKAKVELLLQLKERVKTGLSKAKDKVNRHTADMKGKLNELKNSHVQAFRSMRNEIPMFDRAMQMLGNPYVLITAGVLSLGAVMNSSVQQAADFNHEFLKIQQLNLDKPKKELSEYKATIKEIAFETGQTGIDTSKAFYDIQSATGLFGDEVADITKKVANFSLATGANLPDAVNQTVKAMKAFGLEAKDIDRLLEANAKTVQSGIVEFDELAKVQTEFAGAAAGAGQSIDTANKLFAAFTSIAKDANTGANMTKTAFEGLTDPRTLEGIKAMGVDIYNTNGEMRNLTGILKDVSGQFENMSSKQINKIIGEIGGPEGLRNMFMKLKTDSQDFFKTLETYDNSKFSLDEALKNAKGDMRIVSQMAKNRLGVIMSEIGNNFLPLWVSALEKVNSVLQFVWDNFDAVWSTVRNVVIALGAAKVGMLIFNAVTAANPIGAVITGVVFLVGLVTWLIKRTKDWASVWEGLKMILSGLLDYVGNAFKSIWDSAKYGIEMLVLKFKSFGQYVKELFGNVGKSIQLALSGNFSGAKEALTAEIKLGTSDEIEQLKKQREEAKAIYDDIQGANWAKVQRGNDRIWKSDEDMEGEANEDDSSNPFETDTKVDPDNPTGTSSTKASESVNKVTGSAGKVRNITVNIDSFVKGGINTENTTLQNMDAPEIERYMTDMFMRVVRNLEMSGG